MKTLFITFSLIYSLSSLAGQQASRFTQKTKNIIQAVNVGNFQTEKAYVSMLKTSCRRNHCSSLEKIKIKEASKHIVLCNMSYLKMNNLKSSDATNICNHKQPIFGCDSLSTPLLRKMCYSANRYSLSLWKKKEVQLKNRFPASK